MSDLYPGYLKLSYRQLIRLYDTLTRSFLVNVRLSHNQANQDNMELVAWSRTQDGKIHLLSIYKRKKSKG